MPQTPHNTKAFADSLSDQEQHLLLDALDGTLSAVESAAWQDLQKKKPAISDEYKRLQATMQQISAAEIPLTEQSLFRVSFFEQQWHFLQKLMQSEREVLLAPVLPKIPSEFAPKAGKLRFLHQSLPPRWYALAAMLLIGLGIGTSLWQWRSSMPQSQQQSTSQDNSEGTAEQTSIAEHRKGVAASTEQQKRSDAKKSLRSHNRSQNNALLKTIPEQKSAMPTKDVLPYSEPTPEALREMVVPEAKPQSAPNDAPTLRNDGQNIKTSVPLNQQMHNSFMPSGAASKSLPAVNAKRAVSTTATQKADSTASSISPQRPLADTLRRK
ncbi:MAG: hypothetical protein EAZ92_09370 [Candidatus Kapaibacterium sp.]|nr:MAG: hypothetical protein EAZ92_09370 [Candidatus Kapabacteria bacterium]